MAIDVGLKRTGLAVTDPLRIIATSLATVASQNLYNFLDSYFKNETVETIVIGDPKNLDGTASENTINVKHVFAELHKRYPAMQLVLIDERFSSKIAWQAIKNSGINRKKRKDKSLIDKISAVVILQSYLDSIQK